MQRDPQDTFFHRRHFVNLGWLVIGATLSAAVTVPTTIALTRRFDSDAPPQRVFVVNADTTRGPSIAPRDTRAVSESLSLDSLRREMRTIEKRLAIGSSVHREVLGAVTARKEVSASGTATEAEGGSMKLPATVHGDIAGDVSPILASGCPATVEDPGATVYLSTSLRAEASAADYTPLFVRLLSPQSANSVVQLSEKTVPLSQANVVPVTLPKVPRHYQLEFGVYKRSDLDKEYPTFYRRICSIEIR